MGLENSNSAVFLGIGDGKITRRMPAPTASSKERVLKDSGKVVHEEIYDKITGTLTGITTREHEQYGKSWLLTIEDGADVFKLQMNYSSGYASAFLKALPNVDLSAPLTIIPKMTIEGQKKKTSMFISQHGQALKWYFTKEHPNGLPAMQQVKIKGIMQWDDTDMMEFLENMVNTQIVPKLVKSAPVAAQVAESVAAGHEHEESENWATQQPAATEGDGKMPF